MPNPTPDGDAELHAIADRLDSTRAIPVGERLPEHPRDTNSKGELLAFECVNVREWMQVSADHVRRFPQHYSHWTRLPPPPTTHYVTEIRNDV